MSSPPTGEGERGTIMAEKNPLEPGTGERRQQRGGTDEPMGRQDFVEQRRGRRFELLDPGTDGSEDIGQYMNAAEVDHDPQRWDSPRGDVSADDRDTDSDSEVSVFTPSVDFGKDTSLEVPVDPGVRVDPIAAAATRPGAQTATQPDQRVYDIAAWLHTADLRARAGEAVKPRNRSTKSSGTSKVLRSIRRGSKSLPQQLPHGVSKANNPPTHSA